MFAKLFKYEAQEMGWQMLVGMLVGILVVFTTGLLSLTGHSFLLATGTSIGAAIGVGVPGVLVISEVRHYYQTIYGSRGYFTNTLAVPGATILGAKSLWMFITVLLNIVWGAAALSWVVLTQLPGVSGSGQSYGTKFVSVWQTIAQVLEHASAVMVIAIILSGLLTAAQFVVWVMCLCALANRFSFASMSTPVALAASAILIYGVFQVIMVVFILAVPLTLSITESGEDQRAQLLFGPVLSVESAGSGIFLPLGMLAIIPLLIVGYWFAHNSLSRHLSLR